MKWTVLYSKDIRIKINDMMKVCEFIFEVSSSNSKHLYSMKVYSSLNVMYCKKQFSVLMFIVHKEIKRIFEELIHNRL